MDFLMDFLVDLLGEFGTFHGFPHGFIDVRPGGFLYGLPYYLPCGLLDFFSHLSVK